MVAVVDSFGFVTSETVELKESLGSGQCTTVELLGCAMSSVNSECSDWKTDVP